MQSGLEGRRIWRISWSIFRSAKPAVWAVAVFVAGVSHSTSQSAEDVRQQLQELKQQYEQTTRQFQQRIDALEAQINKQNETKQDEAKKNDASTKTR